MLLVIGNTDLTQSIQEDNYDVQSYESYYEWIDANYNKHRVDPVSKVKGKINIICGGANCISTDDFWELINANKTGNKIELGVYVTNESQFKSVTCFYSIQNVKYKESNNKSINIFTINLEEC